jgi:DNA-binding transcriptional ArsR family regulator
VPDSAWYSLQSSWLKAMAHPARLQILGVLRQGEACVCHLEATLGYRQAYLSQQLAVLRQAGLLAERKDGLFVFYRVASPRVFRVLDAATEEFRDQDGGERPHAREAACTCPKCSPAVPN